MTSWPDVGLALAGAPIGALITVGGVWITNRHNREAQQRLLDSQERQQRERLEFDLRVNVQRESLQQRSTLYLRLLSSCDWADNAARWATAGDSDQGPITNDDLVSTWDDLPGLRREVDIHCSAAVRAATRRFVVAFKNVDETVDASVWDELRAEAKNLSKCVLEAAVLDRTSGSSSDGLGGA